MHVTDPIVENMNGKYRLQIFKGKYQSNKT